MQAKCETLRKLVIQEIEKNANRPRGEKKRSHSDIAKQFDIHKNTVGKYARQSRALEVTAHDVQSCVDQLGIPQLHLIPTDALPRLSLTGDDLLHALEAKETLNGRRANSSSSGTRMQHEDAWWIVKGKHWVKDDHDSDAKYVILQAGMRCMPVPSAKKGGGLVASTMKLQKHHKIYLTQVLHSTTLSLMNAAEYIRVHVDDSFPHVSETTLYNVAKAMGFSKKRSSHFDPKQVAILAKALEETNFHHELNSKNGGVLRGENLLFMDESNFYLNMAEDPGNSWGVNGKGTVNVPISKGKAQYLSLILTVGLVFDPKDGYKGDVTSGILDGDVLDWQHLKGIAEQPISESDDPTKIGGWSLVDGTPAGLDAHLLLFWHIVPPTRKPHLDVRYDFEEPFTKEEEAYWNDLRKLINNGILPAPSDGAFIEKLEALDISSQSNKRLVEKGLFFLGVDARRVLNGQIVANELASDADLKDRFVSVVGHKKRTNLPRRFVGQKYKGGTPQPELSTTSKFMHYLKTLAAYTRACFGKTVLNDSRVFLDNAPTHGRVNVDSNAASFLHAYANVLDFEGAVFPPALSPKYNIAEVAFAYIKTLIRNTGMPPSGQHSVASMTDMIETALMQVTPAMVAAWVCSRGYRFDGAIAHGKLPLGLFTQPFRSTTGETVFGTGKCTRHLRATGELDPEAMRHIAYPVRAAEVEDNTDIVRNELGTINGLIHRVANMRFEYQDAITEDNAAIGDIQATLSKDVQIVLGDFVKHLPLYTATYSELAMVMGKVKTTESRSLLNDGDYDSLPMIASLTWAQLDDAMLVLAEVAKYHTKAINRAGTSKRALCALGVKSACDEVNVSTASLCARSFPMRRNNLVCMNKMGQIANSQQALANRSQQKHKRFSSTMGEMQRVIDDTARLVATHGVRLVPTKITDLFPVDDGTPHPLQTFAEQVVSYTQNGALRPTRQPCAKVVQSADGKTLVRVIVRDWNSWTSISEEEIGTSLSQIVTLKEYTYPEYLLEDDVTEEQFDQRNKWGTMIIRVASSSAPPLLYKHVGFPPVQRIRQIALASMTPQQLNLLGAKVLEVDQPDDGRNDMSYHMHTRAHLPLWIIEELKSMLHKAAGDPSTLSRSDIASGGLYSQIWEHFRHKAAKLSLSHDAMPSDRDDCQTANFASSRCINFRKLRRLMLDMKFPESIVKSAQFYDGLTKDGHVPLFSATQLRSRSRWERQYAADRSKQKGDVGTQQRWPGYPKTSYSDALLSIRDVPLIYNPTTTDKTKLAHLREYADVGITDPLRKEALQVLIPYSEYTDVVFLQLNRNDSSFSTMWGDFQISPTLFKDGFGKPHDKFSSIRTLVDGKRTLGRWKDTDFELWNELMHDQAGARAPSSGDTGVCMLPAVLFMTKGEYTELVQPDDGGIDKFDMALERFLWRYINDGHHSEFKHDIHALIKGTIDASSDANDDDWIVYLPNRIDLKSQVIDEGKNMALMPASGISLKNDLSTIESRLRVGIPWNFIRTTELRPTKEIFENQVVRAYDIDEFSAIDYKSAINALRELYIDQANGYIPNNDKDVRFLKTARDVANSLVETVTAKVRTNGSYWSAAEEYISQFQQKLGAPGYVEQNNELPFWPIVSDRMDYYIIESVPATVQQAKYSIQHIKEIEDSWVKALVDICQQRNKQREGRVGRVPKNVKSPAPPPIKKQPAQFPANDGSCSPELWLVAEQTDEPHEKYDAFALAFQMADKKNKSKRGKTFRVYLREGAKDEDNPGVFRCVSSKAMTYKEVYHSLPRPWLTSADKLLRCYGATKHKSMLLAIKGLCAYANGVGFTKAEDVCVLESGAFWICSSHRTTDDKLPVIRVRQGGTCYQNAFFVVHTVLMDSPRTIWFLNIQQIKTFGLPLKFY